MLKYLRFWPQIATSFAILAVVSVHLVVDRLTREPPNYSRIEEGLWLGGFVVAPPAGTQTVLNLCESEDPYQVESHRWEPIRDAEPAPTLEWLSDQVRFIQNDRAKGRQVYVHCRNGVSRSGMVVVAYVMARDHCSRDEAIERVRSQRSGLRPNPAFLRLLTEWEQFLKS